MSLKRLFTILKGSVNDFTDEEANKRAITETNQKIREAEEQIRKTDSSLVSVLARQKQASQRVVDLQEEISKREEQVRQLSAQGKSELAMKAVADIQKFRPQLEQALATEKEYTESVQIMRDSVQEDKETIGKLKTEIELIDSRAQMQKAQEATLSVVSGSNNKTRSAIDSLEALKAQQSKKSFEIEAAKELKKANSPESLDDEINAALNDTSAEAELARILGK